MHPRAGISTLRSDVNSVRGSLTQGRSRCLPSVQCAFERNFLHKGNLLKLSSQLTRSSECECVLGRNSSMDTQRCTLFRGFFSHQKYQRILECESIWRAPHPSLRKSIPWHCKNSSQAVFKVSSRGLKQSMCQRK